MRRARGLSARFARSRTAYPGPCAASRKCGAPSGAACGEWRNSEAMARSLKKGPFVDGHLREKVEALNTRNEKKVDRKSTRLNSSHGYISYAVFCLKKKNDYRRGCPRCSLPQLRTLLLPILAVQSGPRPSGDQCSRYMTSCVYLLRSHPGP